MQGRAVAINYGCQVLCPALALPLSSIEEKKPQLNETGLTPGSGMTLQFQSRRDQVPEVHVQNQLIPDPPHLYGHGLELVHRDRSSLTRKTCPP